MGLYWEPCPGGARLLRLLGDTPCPAVPGTIEGLPVAELGPYCFADRPVRPGARRTGDDAHEITGNFVEEVTLPDTVRVLDSAAFYNCRRLRRVTLGPGVEGFGSDLFTNCRQLQTFRPAGCRRCPDGLKKAAGGRQRGHYGGIGRVYCYLRVLSWTNMPNPEFTALRCQDQCAELCSC